MIVIALFNSNDLNQSTVLSIKETVAKCQEFNVNCKAVN